MLTRTTVVIVFALLLVTAPSAAQDATETPAPTPSETPPPTLTETPVPTDIPTPISTETPTATETPTLTETWTETPTATASETATETPTADASVTASETLTLSPTATETATASLTPSLTATIPTTHFDPAALGLNLLYSQNFDGTSDPYDELYGFPWPLVENAPDLALQIITDNQVTRVTLSRTPNRAIQGRFLVPTGAAKLSVRQKWLRQLFRNT